MTISAVVHCVRLHSLLVLKVTEKLIPYTLPGDGVDRRTGLSEGQSALATRTANLAHSAAHSANALDSTTLDKARLPALLCGRSVTSNS